MRNDQPVNVGNVISDIGQYIQAAGAVTSASADIANGDILAGVTTIIGAAGTCIGASVNMSTLAQTGTQFASRGLVIATQLVQMNQDAQNQQGNQQKKQPDQKKIAKIKSDKRTQGYFDFLKNNSKRKKALPFGRAKKQAKLRKSRERK